MFNNFTTYISTVITTLQQILKSTMPREPLSETEKENDLLRVSFIKTLCARISEALEDIDGICDKEAEPPIEPSTLGPTEGIGMVLFMKDKETELRTQYPAFADSEIMSILFMQWQQLPQETKAQYCNKVDPSKLVASKKLRKLDKLSEKLIEDISEARKSGDSANIQSLPSKEKTERKQKPRFYEIDQVEEQLEDSLPRKRPAIEVLDSPSKPPQKQPDQMQLPLLQEQPLDAQVSSPTDQPEVSSFPEHGQLVSEMQAQELTPIRVQLNQGKAGEQAAQNQGQLEGQAGPISNQGVLVNSEAQVVGPPEVQVVVPQAQVFNDGPLQPTQPINVDESYYQPPQQLIEPEQMLPHTSVLQPAAVEAVIDESALPNIVDDICHNEVNSVNEAPQPQPESIDPQQPEALNLADLTPQAITTIPCEQPLDQVPLREPLVFDLPSLVDSHSSEKEDQHEETPAFKHIDDDKLERNSVTEDLEQHLGQVQ